MGTEDDFWCLKGNWWPKVNNLEIQIKELGIRDGGFWTRGAVGVTDWAR